MAVKVRLTPTLFDKLVSGNDLAGIGANDESPSVSRDEFRNFAPANVERFTEAALRATVRRDLAWLLNTLSLESAQDLSKHPWVQKSVLNFGVRDFAGRSSGDRNDREQAREIRAAILRFEPRLNPRTLRVEPVRNADLPGKVSFFIEAEVMGGPKSLPVRFRTDIDVETATVEVNE
ncbi:Gene 25-like lysozyme [Tsuneonella dongtanensis]|uniref:Gene 25-like lysozyme n=1 Tax=Tsuneonella dongtanensis TaxID=692370 RepID=A0A1B2ABC5_9SPHN|nr:type VI secretion system baseplate subunit TssE [Tsuneonella dongtanensis]ANY19401.1 Gene 25-like lysozyme [Tsuneonella dongtanensis]